jgi:hypothetical protein
MKTQMKTLLTNSELKMAKQLSKKAIQQETSSSGFDHKDLNKKSLNYLEDITSGLHRPTSRRLCQLFIEQETNYQPINEV